MTGIAQQRRKWNHFHRPRTAESFKPGLGRIDRMSTDSDGPQLDEGGLIRIGSATERWRVECPVGHRGTKLKPHPESGHWSCRRCRELGIDPEYSYARDQKTGRYLAPDEVEINTRSNP